MRAILQALPYITRYVPRSNQKAEEAMINAKLLANSNCQKGPWSMPQRRTDRKAQAIGEWIQPTDDQRNNAMCLCNSSQTFEWIDGDRWLHRIEDETDDN